MLHAPVEYVLAVVRFPSVADFGRFASELQVILEPLYPLSREFETPQFRFEVGKDGMNVSQETHKTWQFSSLERDWAVITGVNFIGLHTVRYTHHEDFIDRFLQVVDLAAKPEKVGIKVVEALGLRYLDLIVPRQGETAEQYLRPGVLPSLIPGIEGLEIIEGVHVGSYRSRSGNLRFQVLRTPPSVFPGELVSPATLDNNWGGNKPDGDFAVMDTDHGMKFEPPLRLAEADLRTNIMDLRNPISEIFLATTTEHAKMVWNGEV